MKVQYSLMANTYYIKNRTTNHQLSLSILSTTPLSFATLDSLYSVVSTVPAVLNSCSVVSVGADCVVRPVTQDEMEVGRTNYIDRISMSRYGVLYEEIVNQPTTAYLVRFKPGHLKLEILGDFQFVKTSTALVVVINHPDLLAFAELCDIRSYGVRIHPIAEAKELLQKSWDKFTTDITGMMK